MVERQFDKLILQSSFDEIDRLQSYLENLQDSAGFSEEQFAKIQLALNEAVTNAIVHGNKEDDSKQVRINARLENDELYISVKDEGPGFDPDSLPDPLDEENLLKESGRGVFLIKQYADRVNFTEEGTKLTMMFNLPGN